MFRNRERRCLGHNLSKVLALAVHSTVDDLKYGPHMDTVAQQAVLLCILVYTVVPL